MRKAIGQGPSLGGGPDLIQDGEALFWTLSESARLDLAIKEAYVLELLAMEADPRFSLRDEHLWGMSERVYRRLVPGGRFGGNVHYWFPAVTTLRRWRRIYLEAGRDPLALLSGY